MLIILLHCCRLAKSLRPGKVLLLHIEDIFVLIVKWEEAGGWASLFYELCKIGK